MVLRYHFLLILIAILCFSNCKQSESSGSKDQILDIAMPADPERINPVINTSAVSRLIHQYIFLSCADYHPETLELYPILLKNIPNAEYFMDGDTRKVRFRLEIKDDAVWDDGTPITGKDYLFTIKKVNHPMVNANAYRSYLSKIEKVEINENNSKICVVTFADDYMLSLETAVTIPIYPSHIYDPNDHFSDYTIQQLKDRAFIEGITNADSTFTNYISDLNGLKFSKDIISNSGPYKITSWTTKQSLALEAKGNYWGSNYPDNPFLQQGPKEMNLYIIPDQTTALSQLKDGSLDLVNYLTSKNFVELRDNEVFEDEFQFFSPVMRRYYILAINNSDPILSDVEVRKAMGHLLEVDKIIKNIDYGMGKRVLNIVHPDRPYYNNDLIAPDFNPEKARQILAASGWEDSDQDGDLDKSNTDLEIDIYVSQSELGRQVALMLQQNAEAIGIKINIVTKEFRAIMGDHVRKRDYGMTPLAINQDLNDDDFYNRWHSENDDPRKSNHLGYKDERADELIMAIRNANNSEERYELYKDLQKVIYEDYPAIFLYAPMEKIIVSNRWNGSATAKRPGYLANTFTAK